RDGGVAVGGETPCFSQGALLFGVGCHTVTSSQRRKGWPGATKPAGHHPQKGATPSWHPRRFLCQMAWHWRRSPRLRGGWVWSTAATSWCPGLAGGGVGRGG